VEKGNWIAWLIIEKIDNRELKEVAQWDNTVTFLEYREIPRGGSGDTVRTRRRSVNRNHYKRYN